jgi:Ca2+-binding RTX toxin-like protein
MFKTKYLTPKSLRIHYGADKDGAWYILGPSTRVDVNGDGLKDVILSLTSKNLLQSEAAPIKVLVSNGQGLVDQTSKYLPFSPTAHVVRNIYVADFNGDQRDDIFLNSHGQEIEPFPGEQNQLFLSAGRYSYTNATATSLPTRSDFSHGGGVGDFDGDGDVDIFSNSLGPQSYTGGSYLLLNDGHGRFEEIASFSNPGAYFPSGLNWGAFWAHVVEMNGDGFPDIYHSGMEHWNGDPSQTKFSALMNDGSGHFAFSIADLPAFPQFPAQVAQDSHHSDIDRDGDLDLLLLDNSLTSGDYIQVLVNDGTGVFTDQSWRIPDQANGGVLAVTNGGPHFDVVDLDGDGDDDIFYRAWTPDWNGTITHAFENRGNGQFARIPNKLLPKFSGNYQILDVNNDGQMDFLGDMTWWAPWLKDKSNQFLLWKGTLATAVTRVGWNTDDQIYGGVKADVLRGKGGNDKLAGREGSDNLFGGIGQDVFLFDTKPSTTTIDRIRDYDVADDAIWLDNGIFKGLGKSGSLANPAPLSAKAFWAGWAAHDANDRLIYNKKTGMLSYDADGSGKGQAVEFALLKKGLAVTYKDFFVI